MPLTAALTRLARFTDRLPHWQKWTLGIGCVAVTAGMRGWLGASWPGAGFPFYIFAVLLAAALGDGGAGYVAAAAAVAVGMYFTPPVGTLFIEREWILPIFVFSVLCFTLAGVIETLQGALRRLRAEVRLRGEAEAARGLLLEEFRHRSRNDLQSLNSLLLLRARTGPPEARDALREAAGHALGLARVHTRLAKASAEGSAAVIDTAEFLRGLVYDLARGAAGDGARPVAILCCAEPHRLSTERAVQLGLITNECVTNALKYAFPGDMGGQVHVRFAREGDKFRLTVADDGIGCGNAATESEAAPPPGLGTRLLRALAAQLRGRFTREPGPEGGTVCTLLFPAAEPGAVS